MKQCKFLIFSFKNLKVVITIIMIPHKSHIKMINDSANKNARLLVVCPEYKVPCMMKAINAINPINTINHGSSSILSIERLTNEIIAPPTSSSHLNYRYVLTVVILLIVLLQGRQQCPSISHKIFCN